MKKLITLSAVFLLLQLPGVVLSQAPNWLWIKSVGGTGNDVAQDVALDHSGNIYVTGSFENTVDFDPGPGVTNLTCNGILDAFLLKLDASGNFAWVYSFGLANSEVGYSVATDQLDNVYVTGRYKGTVDFNPGPGVDTVTSGGNFDIFIVKFDSQGVFQWVKSVGGSADDQAFSIAVDPFGNVIICGYYQAIADFDPGSGMQTLQAAGGYDGFVLKLESASGAFFWVHGIGGVLMDAAIAVSTDAAGNVYETGHFNGIMDFDPGAAIVNLPQGGGDDIYIRKFDPTGNFIWARMLGGVQTDWTSDLAANSLGDVYSTGTFRGIADFDPGASVFNLNATSQTGEDFFTSKLDASGNFGWAAGTGSANQDEANAITLDAAGNVYMGGFFRQGADMNPGSGVDQMTSFGDNDAFITKFDNAGNYFWTKRLGGAAADDTYGLACDANGKAVVTGTMMSQFVVTNVGDTLFNTTPGGVKADIFIGKLDSVYISGVKDVTAIDFSIYPNPAHDQFTVQLSNSSNTKNKIEVLDVTGNLVYASGELITHRATIKTHSFAPGIYFVRVYANEFYQTQKLIITQ